MSTAPAETFAAERILALPTYNWDVADVGDEAPPFSQTITRESIAKYCEAVRNWNPLYLDEAEDGSDSARAPEALGHLTRDPADIVWS